jgi:hypothetical protein
MWTDSLIAFKCGLTTSFGIFFICFMSMLYKDGRPFWEKLEIQPYGNCLYNFSSPSLV